jgi:type I restriction enzyme S subunit
VSRIDDLIQRHCPEGVEYRAIGDVGQLVRGNGMPKTDFVESGVGCIHYGQIYTHYRTWATATISFVPPEKAAKLARVDPGDVIVTNTSENIDDVCKAVAWLGSEQIVTGGHATVLKHDQDPKFLAYYLQTRQFHADKKRFVTGTKVMDVSAKRLAMIRIPVPPLEVQREIVRVLDLFQSLEAELEAELEARRRQYAHYRDSLLTFPDERGGVRWMTLGDVAIVGTGSRNTNEATTNGTYPFFVRSQEPLRIGDYEFEETAILTAGDGVGVGKVFHFVEGRYALHQRAYRIRVVAPDLSPRFLFHFIRHDFARYLATTSVHASVTSLRKPMFERYPLPVPSLEDQEQIVRVLDRFDALTADLSSGLPAELAARRKQYEYYRDRLLTFEEAA